MRCVDPAHAWPASGPNAATEPPASTHASTPTGPSPLPCADDDSSVHTSGTNTSVRAASENNHGPAPESRESAADSVTGTVQQRAGGLSADSARRKWYVIGATILVADGGGVRSGSRAYQAGRRCCSAGGNRLGDHRDTGSVAHRRPGSLCPDAAAIARSHAVAALALTAAV